MTFTKPCQFCGKPIRCAKPLRYLECRPIYCGAECTRARFAVSMLAPSVLPVMSLAPGQPLKIVGWS